MTLAGIAGAGKSWLTKKLAGKLGAKLIKVECGSYQTAEDVSALFKQELLELRHQDLTISPEDFVIFALDEFDKPARAESKAIYGACVTTFVPTSSR